MQWLARFRNGIPVLLLAGLLGCGMISQPVQSDGPTLAAPRKALTFEGAKDEFTRSIEDASWSLTTSEENAERVYPRLITNENRWAEAWSQLEGSSLPPKVDFKRDFLYILVVDEQDHNRKDIDFEIDRDGVFSASCCSTLLAFRTSELRNVYVFEFPRSGIKAYRDRDSRNGELQVFPIVRQQDR